MTANRSLVWATATACAVVLLLGWVALRGGRETTRAVEHRLPSLAPHAGGEALDQSSAPAEPGADAVRREPTEGSQADPSSSASGVLRLRFVSALDRSPVPDLPFAVFRERGGYRLFGRGRSDARGEAELGGLEENVILVETERHPPFARKTAALWLPAGKSRSLDVELDAGARVTGRIVDDEGRPMRDAEIVDAADLGGRHGNDEILLDTSRVAATSGADGRFVVDHASSAPTAVWIVDGEQRPERWVPARFAARKDGHAEPFQADVKPLESKDVGDVVLARAATYRGRVLDVDGLAVEGALVSLRMERRFTRRFAPSDRKTAFRIAPGQPGFQVLASETLTDPAGRFELKGRPEFSGAAVWTSDGRIQLFDLPPTPPGDVEDGIELRLKPSTLLEVEFLDSRGERIRGPGPAVREPRLSVAWTRGLPGMAMGPAVMEVRLADGSKRGINSVCDADGLFRFEIDAPPSDLVSMRLALSGYEPVEDSLAAGARAQTRLSYTLREIPAFHLRLLPKHAARDEGRPLALQIQICLAAPARRATPSPEDHTLRCCGRGAFTWFDWSGEERTFVLPAIERAPYWVYLRSPRPRPDRAWPPLRIDDVAAFGPFEPGADVRDLEADLEELRAAIGSSTAEEEKQPPPKIEPGEELPAGFVSLQLVDAKTGEDVGGAWVEASAVGSEPGKRASHSLWPGASGRVERKKVPAGRWTIDVHADRYRAPPALEQIVVEGGHTDLGVIEMEPLPVLRGRLVNADGSHASSNTWLSFSTEAGLDARATLQDSTDAEGRFEFLGELGARGWLHVVEWSDDSRGQPRGVQRIALEPWPPGEERTVTLALWQTVEVRVSGPAVLLPESTLHLDACPAPGEQGWSCDHRLPPVVGHGAMAEARERDPEAGVRVFHLRLAPGRYQIFGWSLLHDVPAIDVDVQVRDAPQIVAVTSQ